MLGVAIAEFERQPAEDQRQQHQQDREIDRGNDDGEGDREGGQQADAAENEPGLVAVPDRRDRVHHQFARTAVGREIVEHADAEIEAVERDIEEDADGEDGGPDRNEVERGHQRVSAVAGAERLDRRFRPAADDGRVVLRGGGAAPDDAQHGVNADREDDQIDGDVEQQRQQHIGAGQRRRDRFRRAHQAVDGPRLAADFGRGPAGDHRDKAEADGELAGFEIPARCHRAACATAGIIR